MLIFKYSFVLSVYFQSLFFFLFLPFSAYLLLFLRCMFLAVYSFLYMSLSISSFL
jgi:hypothetical protein